MAIMIRKLQQLSKTNITEVNAFDFRNLREVEKYLGLVDDKLQETEEDLKRYKQLFAANAFKIQAWLSERNLARQERGATTFNITPPKPTRKGRIKPLVQNQKVKVPNLRKLEKNFTLLEELLRMRDNLQSLQVKVQNGFQDDKRLSAVTNHIKKEQASVKRQIKETMDFLHEVAKRKVPDDFHKMTYSVFRAVLKDLEGRYEKANKLVIVRPFEVEDDSYLEFAEYLELQGLRNDNGFTYKRFYIVIYLVADESGRSHYYIGTQLKFQPPSTRPLDSRDRGISFDTKRMAIRLIQTHLRMDEKINVLKDLPLPLSDEEIKQHKFKMSQVVKKIVVDEDSSLIKFYVPKKCPIPKEELISSLYSDVQHLFSAEDGSTVGITYKVTVTSTYRVFNFHVTQPASDPRMLKDYRVSRNMLNNFQQEFNLSDQEVRKMVQLIGWK